jgi:type I restriction enzyme S subunit
MNWTEIRLEEIADFRNGVNFTNDSFGKGIKVINVADFKDRMYPEYESLGELDGEAKWHKDCFLKENDIVFVRSNGNKNLIGRSLFIKNLPTNIRVTYSAFSIRLRFKSIEDICPEFYLYLFKSPIFRSILSQYGNGANISNLNQDILNNMYIPKPPLPVQEKIASILSSYDELIENNKQRIKLLDEMVEEIYKEWFVRLRFPGYENSEIVDGVPKGWERKPIDEFFSFSISKAKLKKFNNTKTYIATADVTDINITGQGEIIDWENKPSRAQLVPELNSVFFARMSNTYKVLVFSKTNKELIDELALTSGFLGLKALNEEILPYLFWLIKSNTFHNYKDVFANGATQVSLTNEGFHNIKLVEPSLSVIEKFGKTTSAFLNEIITLNKKNQLLQEARDLLLPRLISGKLSVEYLVEEELAMVAEPKETY